MIYITDDAALKIKNVFEENNMSKGSAIRFAVKGGGCNGFTIDIKLEPPRRYEMSNKRDSKFLSNNVRVLVDKKSLLFLDETTVDFIKKNFGYKFTYDNPNASGWCGCDESFNI